MPPRWSLLGGWNVTLSASVARAAASLSNSRSTFVAAGPTAKTTHPPPSRGNTSERFPPLASKQTFFFWPIKTYCAGCCFPLLLCFALFLFFFSPAWKISIKPDEAVGEYAIGFISQAARTKRTQKEVKEEKGCFAYQWRRRGRGVIFLRPGN